MNENRRVTPKTAKRVTDERERALFVISVAAELAGVHPQTLRMYERKGLINPQRTSGNTRRYSQHDIDLVRLIQELTQAKGVNLAGVEIVMELTRELEEAESRMERLRREAVELERRLTENLQRAREAQKTALVLRRSIKSPFIWEDR
jgi:MerR family transcriptional regulator/heat shock protein HspR